MSQLKKYRVFFVFILLLLFLFIVSGYYFYGRKNQNSLHDKMLVKKNTIITEQDFIGIWEPSIKQTDSQKTQFSLENSRYVYRDFLNGKLVCEGSWTLYQIVGGVEVGIICEQKVEGQEPFTISLEASLNKEKQELLFVDEGETSVYIRVK